MDLINANWHWSDDKHQQVDGAIMSFHTTVAINRSYDLAFTSTNPRHLRLLLPNAVGHHYNYSVPWDLTGYDLPPTTDYHRKAQESRILVGIFFSNIEKVEVYRTAPTYQCEQPAKCDMPPCEPECWWKPMNKFVPPLEAHMKSNNQFNFSMVKPVITDPCGSNAFAAWEKKIYVVVCGGAGSWVEIRQVPFVVLSLGFEITTEDFFDPQYLVRNLASVFGIPQDRMRIPSIVPGSLNVDVEVQMADPCGKVTSCGAHGVCSEGACICNDGWVTPVTCEGGDCMCTVQAACASTCALCNVTNPTTCIACPATGNMQFLHQGDCVASCPSNHYADLSSRSCKPCDSTCSTCNGGKSSDCTSCDSVGTVRACASKQDSLTFSI